MNWLPPIFRRNLYNELAEEMREHLEERTEQLEREGMSRKEAERAARRAFGNPTLLEERSREVWQWPTFESIWADIRYALRQLRKSPGFTITVILSLALGLGANTAIFTLVNALLFLPPTVSDAGRLVEVMQQHPKDSGIESYSPLSYPGYIRFRDHNHTLSGFAAFDGDPHPVSWSNAGYGQMVHGQLVSSNFFSVAGVEPALGRAFNADEDRTGAAHPVILISYSFWRNRLAADPSVIGRVLVLNGTSFTIVGVTPANFTGVLIGSRPDFWASFALTPVLTRDPQRLSTETSFWLFGLGRLKPDVTRIEVQADLSVISHSMSQKDAKGDLEVSIFPLQLVPGPFRGYVAAFTGLLMAAVGLVLLIACANATNLLLARAITRRRELALRTTLGASRLRLIRQTLTESILLSLAGGVGGLLLARWSIPLLLSLKPASFPIFFEAPLDWRVYSFALFVSLFAGIVFGIAPALRSPRLELLSALKDESKLAGPRRSWLRDSIVVVQVTVCLVLLISAGLCVRSLLNARSIDPGFSTHDVVLAQLDPSALGYTEAQQRQFYLQLLEKVRSLPGIRSASLSSSLPLGTDRMVQGVNIDGFTPPSGQDFFPIQYINVAPGFFAAMGIPILNGHDFSTRDLSSADIHGGSSEVVINQAMADRFWPNQNPIGRYIKSGKQTLAVVGVVKTGKYRSLGEDPQLFMYRPFNYSSKAILVARNQFGAQSSLDGIRHIVLELDPNIVPMDMESIAQYMALPLFFARTTGVLLTVFGAVALLLATIGLSGVVSYSVSQRTNEIGVRMALGANRLTVLTQILRQGMRLTMIGIVFGLALSFAATRLLAGLLYGVKPGDPATYVAVSVFLAAVAFVSCYLPARRAASIDPMQALRAE
jgi:putative ABC transport system permease protein